MSEALFDAVSQRTTINLYCALVEFVEHGATQTNEGVDAMIDALPRFLAEIIPTLYNPASREKAKLLRRRALRGQASEERR